MRDWNLQRGDPLSLVLAADARLGTPDYLDDQIWELRLRAGEPAALSLQTTYGLRARDMRILPRFSEGDRSLSDPDLFARPPAVHRFFPNYLLVTFSPFTGIDVVYELWVPESHAVAGRMRIINHGVTPRSVGWELAALLIPQGEGERMTPTRMQGVTILQGQTLDLAPVVFLTGGSEGSSSPYPSLSQSADLLPGLERQCLWVHAARPSPEESFDLARQVAARPWEAEIARIELTNSSLVEVHTGDPAWDAALALGQKVALGLVHGPTPHLPHPFFVLARGPDQGYSMRGDGSEYNFLWNGQTALDTWHLVELVLLSAPDLARGFLENFLATQEDHAYIDWKPSPTGRRSRLDATPLLATLAWEVYRQSRDLPFLEAVFPDLLTFGLSWFGPYHDRDGDGIPEWDDPLQSGFDDHPVFARWPAWAQGVDITTSESPSLCAMLYRECRSLIKIADELGRDEPRAPLEALAENLRVAVEAAWDEKASIYRYWDRDTHQSPAGKTVLQLEGEARRRLNRPFAPPARLLLRMETDPQASRRGTITLRGITPDSERISLEVSATDLRWHLGQGTWTSEQVFSRLTGLQVSGVLPGTRVSVQTVDYTHRDHSLLLPLWAGIPAAERARALVEDTILSEEGFGRPSGLVACADPPSDPTADMCRAVWIPWNAMIARGLVAYGYRAHAADLMGRIMRSVVATLRSQTAFRGYYQAETGEGFGDRNALSGLPPLGLFLDILGVRLLSPWQVALEGANPFPWPVKVKYRGLTVLRTQSDTEITFPDGETVSIHGDRPCRVEGRPSGAHPLPDGHDKAG